MKKKIILCLLVLAMVLSVGMVYTSAAVVAWHYDNSFLITLECPHGQALEVVLPEVFGETTLVQKTAGESVDTYKMVVTAPGGGDWDTLKQSLVALQGVVLVERNPYANDYGEKNSFVKTSQTKLDLNIGEIVEVQVEDYLLTANDGYEVIGVEFSLIPNAVETIEEGCFAGFRIGTFWAVPADAEKTNGGHVQYKNYFIDDWFDDELKNTRSDTNTYFGIPTFMEEDWKSGNSISGVRAVLDALGSDPRVAAVQPIYRDAPPIGFRPYEWWWMGNTSVAKITTMTNTEELPDWWTEEPSTDPADHTECFFHKHTVSVQGLKKGTAILRVMVGDNGIEQMAEIPITVSGDLFSGDVDGNGKTEAADALMILKQVVGKITLNENEMDAADLNDDGEIGADDALCVLRLVVGKPAV